MQKVNIIFIIIDAESKLWFHDFFSFISHERLCLIWPSSYVVVFDWLFGSPIAMAITVRSSRCTGLSEAGVPSACTQTGKQKQQQPKSQRRHCYRPYPPSFFYCITHHPLHCHSMSTAPCYLCQWYYSLWLWYRELFHTMCSYSMCCINVRFFVYLHGRWTMWKSSL
jgi:hypothetical protein